MQMFDGDRCRPGDQRAFLHKKIFGAVSKLAGLADTIGIPGASAVSAITGRLAGRPRRVSRQPMAAPVSLAPPVVSVIPATHVQTQPMVLSIPGGNKIRSLAGREAGPAPRLPFHTGAGNGTGSCRPPMIWDPRGFCVTPTSPLGAATFGGDVIAGQYGAGYIAGSRVVDVAQCPRGTVLGKDGICYANLANKNRLYPRGRRPLLTGGDMRAISRARTAGNRLANAKSDLIAIGMLKAAGPRKRRKKAPSVC